MTRRASLVTSTDVALLRALAQEPSIAGASRRLGISRDRAVYRIERLEQAFGGPVTRGVRGGRGHGGTALTPLGDRIARGGFDSVELLGVHPVMPLSEPNVLHGVYRRAPGPEVRVGRGLRLRVAFPADDGATVGLLLDPEAILVARRRFPSSARNVLAGTVETIRADREELGVTLVVRVGPVRLRVAMTEEPVAQLGLKPGTPVWLYVKATALRRVDDGRPAALSPGSPRS